MNCATHPEAQAIAFCRTCGKALCNECTRPAQGTVFCVEHVPVAAPSAAAQPGATVPPPAASYVPPASPYTSPYAAATTASSVSPGLAFLLGLIPGVGAVYNGQYAKGLVHALIFGLLISIANSGVHELEPVMVMLLVAFYCYMPIEAYHTARKRRAGEPVEEFSGVMAWRGPQAASGRFPMGAVVLIVGGGILLLNTTGILEFREIARYWPVILIGVGAYMLYDRFSASEPPAPSPEVRNEHQ